MTKINTEKTPFWISFFRSQSASIIATGADFLMTIFCVEILRIWYVTGTATGNLTGAIISFLLGRNWAFNQKNDKMWKQAIRYALTSLTSMGLNTAGVFFFTETFDIPYIYSKIVAAVLVGVCFNFLMFRYFVFK